MSPCVLTLSDRGRGSGGPPPCYAHGMHMFALLLALGCAKPPPDNPAPAPLDTELPFDPGVRTGTLDNGLRWFVEPNAEPRDRAVLRLVVDAGSVLEDDDQLGLAHVLEHMAFNGSAHFEGNDLIRTLESMGASFGPHLNAHTSFDETVYKLAVPTDDAEVFETALLILEDWAHGLTLDPAQIEAERGVVLEEWRGRLGASDRISRALLPATYHGSPYPDRLPIGTEASLAGFTPEAVRRFYEDWYRPELMAVIVVGDVDPDAVQAQLEARFSTLASSTEPRPRLRPELPAHADTLYDVVTDPEMPSGSVRILSKRDDVEGTTHRDYRDGFVDSMVRSMLNERFADLARSPDPPFLGAAAHTQRLTPTEGADVLAAGTVEDGTVRALEALLVELERAQRHGFTRGELDRAVRTSMRHLQRAWSQRDTTASEVHADEIIRHFTTGEPMPGIGYERELAERYLPGIGLDEVDARVRTLFGADSRAISVILPDKDGLEPPTVAELEALVAEVPTRDVEPLADSAVDGPLVPEPPTPGAIVARTPHPELGFEQWTLSNGVEVWVRPTDFTADEVRFGAFSHGGHGGVPDELYVPAATATSLQRRSGLGAFTASDLEKRHAGSTARASLGVTSTRESVSGSASPDDLAEALQLVYLGFTAPRFDADALELERRHRETRLRNRASDPSTLFADAFGRLAWDEDVRFRPWTLAHLDDLSLERSRAVHAERFGDAGDFTFAFVGAFDPDALAPLVEQWLGSLPAAGRTEEAGTRPGLRRSGVRTETLRAGTEPRAKVRIEFDSELDADGWLLRNRLQALSDILGVRLREELREERGGVYSVRTSGSSYTWPHPYVDVTVSFSCDPERVEELTEQVFAIAAELREAPVDEHYIADEITKRARGREEALRTNSFWLDGLLGALRRGEDPRELLTYDARNESLSAADVQEAAQRWLDPERYAMAVLLPE